MSKFAFESGWTQVEDLFWACTKTLRDIFEIVAIIGKCG